MALSDPTRRQILLLLRGRAATAGTIAAAFSSSVSRPAISRHLRVLRAAGLVRDEVDGRERIYSLVLEGLAGLDAFLRELRETRVEKQARYDAVVTRVRRGRRVRPRAAAAPPTPKQISRKKRL